MIGKALAVAALAAFGTTATAAAQVGSVVDEPQAPVVHSDAQGYCQQAGVLSESLGLLEPGEWSCQDGQMTAVAPAAGPFP